MAVERGTDSPSSYTTNQQRQSTETQPQHTRNEPSLSLLPLSPPSKTHPPYGGLIGMQIMHGDGCIILKFAMLVERNMTDLRRKFSS